jgi:hypothetical protein
VPSEAQEQRVVVEWAERHKGKWPELALLFHVPNGGARDAREAALLVAEGVKRGVPDLLLPVPQGGYVGLALELKRADHSSQPTAEQLIWHNAMRLNRWRVDVSYGADEAIAVLDEYLSQKDDPA